MSNYVGRAPAPVSSVTVTLPEPPAGTWDAVPTFHNMSLYYVPPSVPEGGVVKVRYRRAAVSTWTTGHDLWYDSRTTTVRARAEARGSICMLASNTEYVIQFGMPAGASINWLHQITKTTWNEVYPEGTVNTSASGTTATPINITNASSGNASAYTVYRADTTIGSTIDVANAQLQCITIDAHHVIIRGFKLKNGQGHGIRIVPSANSHDIIIEDCEISGWGRNGTTDGGSDISLDGIDVGRDFEGAITCANTTDAIDCPDLKRVVIQRCKIFDPRYGSNTWRDGHPRGPQAVTFSNSGGNHVIRYSEFYSTTGTSHHFNDVLGCGTNFSEYGFPGRDSDIYKNKFSHWMDDGVESEGDGMNIRIYKNVFDVGGTVFVASESVSLGPLYIFRNVFLRGHSRLDIPLDSDAIGLSKSGDVPSEFPASGAKGGRRYWLHNTSLITPVGGSTYGDGATAGIQEGSAGRPLNNTWAINNIIHLKKDWWEVLQASQAAPIPGKFQFNLYVGVITNNNNVVSDNVNAIPTYKSGNGYVSGMGGKYQLQPGTAGHNAGTIIANFSDGYQGAAPDMGAHEEGTPDMTFGILATGT